MKLTLLIMVIVFNTMACKTKDVTAPITMKYKTVDITWSVSSIANISSFSIDKLDTQTKEYKPVGKVAISESIKYTFTDKYALDSLNKYRLTVFLNDGENFKQIIVK
jgi:hypothetical protein